MSLGLALIRSGLLLSRRVVATLGKWPWPVVRRQSLQYTCTLHHPVAGEGSWGHQAQSTLIHNYNHNIDIQHQAEDCAGKIIILESGKKNFGVQWRKSSECGE